MGQNSKIEWTHDTWNLWRGCTEVSPACDHCYAREIAKRNPAVLGQWGPGAPRVLAAGPYRTLPLKWNEQAKAAGVRKRVFSLSLGDWLDDEVPIEWLAELLAMVHATPHLDWLLLTKRPENWYRRVTLVEGEMAESWIDCIDMPERGVIPANVWIGTTVEDQERAELRIPALLRIPARVRFLSCEPLLAPVNLEAMRLDPEDPLFRYWPLDGRHIRDGMNEPVRLPLAQAINWVIAGGESGPHARPMHPEWVRGLRDQCAEAKVPFLFKQWGDYAPEEDWQLRVLDDPKKAGQWTEMTTACSTDKKQIGKVSIYAHDAAGKTVRMRQMGKQAAGRSLDGKEWDQFPNQQLAIA